jgi:two-component system response regulator AtoC
MSLPRVLVVDERERVVQLLERLLAPSCSVVGSSNAREALSRLGREPFDVVVANLRMARSSGIEILLAAKAREPSTEVLLTAPAFASAEAGRAVRMGALAWLEEPLDLDAALRLVLRAAERRRLAPVREAGEERSALVGDSARMREIRHLLLQAADLDVNVLLEGDPGTGKELAGRVIHYRSARRERGFVVCACSSLDAESEGHAPELFQEATGGTLFLDEVAALPLPLQDALLLQLRADAAGRADGGSQAHADVRVIATTCLDLSEEARAGRFRDPLLQLLRGFPIRMPALRERIEDLPALAARFLAANARSLRRELTGFAPEALRTLSAYSWPGNVRELVNAVAQAASACRDRTVGPSDLPPAILAAVAAAAPAGHVLASLPYRKAMELEQERASREYLVALLTEFRGNVSRAAARAGLERESLHRLLRRHSIRSEEFKRAV